jgi:hypothetical protein
MSRQRFLTLVAFLFAWPAARVFAGEPGLPANPGPSVPGADVEPAKPKLVFTYPCAFAYADGKPYAERVMDFECDYIHASLKGGKDYLNNLPTVEAQLKLLSSMIPDADAAHTEYMTKVADLLKETDPTRIPKTVKVGGKTIPMPEAERLKRLNALNIWLSTGVFAAAHPFLWPPREGDSYLDKSAGSWPESWRPYIQPLYQRLGEVSSYIQTDESRIIDKAHTDLEAKLKRSGLTAAVVQPGAAVKMFDGGGGAREPQAAVAPDAPGKAVAHRGVDLEGAIPVRITDLADAPPPIPTAPEERAQRNYFDRGYAAGLKRLKDDASMALLRASGQSTTIGDPYGKTHLIVRQKGPSCAVGAQYEAMRAREQQVNIAALAREGRDKGYYADYPLVNGERDGGTTDANLNSLLIDHGVKSSVVHDGTPQQLDQSIRRSGDAIVTMVTKKFWNDPAQPDSSRHAVYVTGEEVDRSGKVLGFYVNDTGTSEAGRFVPIDDFKRAWTGTYVSIHDAPKP